MSWKSAESQLQQLRLSISVRLTLLYTLTSFVAVAVFTGVLYWMLTANFNAEHLRFLHSKAEELTEDFQDGGNQPAALLLAEIAKETSGTVLSQYRARVLTAQNHTLGGTPNMDTLLPSSIFPAAIALRAINKTVTRDYYSAGHHFVLVAFQLLSPNTADRAYSVQLALDVTRDDTLLADYRRGLILFLALLFPILMLAGHAVTTRGLRPLKRISLAAQAVTPARLSERIPLDPPWPPELEELVHVFNGMVARLEEAFTRLSRFSADLAHELRTPLNNLMGELEVCLSRERSQVDYQQTLSSNLEECRRLASLIENLLFIARAEGVGRSIGSVDFDAGETCTQVLAYHATSAADKGVKLMMSDGDVMLNADPILFRQALSNLVANAIRHSQVGDTVSVLLRTQDGTGVEIEVRDQGDGIAPEHLPHVFDRFYQADPSRSCRGQGTGLGLSIVRSIMELHGGTASLESEFGRGTVVMLRFPAHSHMA